MTLQQILEKAIEKGASDIFIIAGLPVTFKVKGIQDRDPEGVMKPADIRPMIDEMRCASVLWQPRASSPSVAANASAFGPGCRYMPSRRHVGTTFSNTSTRSCCSVSSPVMDMSNAHSCVMTEQVV